MLFAEESEFMERETCFVEVILPLSLAINYTYRVPFALNERVAPGKRVVVQFGKHKIYTALIRSISHIPPAAYEAKYIIDVVDEQAIVSPLQLRFWEWMRDYYLCNLGDVMAAALPSALKLASETLLVLEDDLPPEPHLNEKERLIFSALQKQRSMKVNAVAEVLGQKSVYPLIQSLLEKGLLYIAEEVVEKYKPLLKTYIYLHDVYKEEANLKHLFAALEKAPKQLDALLAYLHLSRNTPQVSRQALLEQGGSGQAAIKALLDKGVFVAEKRPVSRLSDSDEAMLLNFSLTEAQQMAFESLQGQLREKEVVLLHGVTSSGKTQVYMRLIEETIARGGQVLFLLPEIALTTQLVERIKRYFGDKTGVYHSKFSDNERVEIWNKVLDGRYQVVVGARSAVFLPFKHLQLVVVDEEHESSYKQHEPAPRYQARDAAIFLAYLHGAKTVLGSATPSIESYYNASTQKYGLVSLSERYGGVALPKQQVVSIATETKQKKMRAYFTSVLLEQMTQTLAAGGQVILFQNRRGYATIVMCATCGYVPKCVNCDVSLTFHKASGRLHCHYCGFHQNTVAICPACGSVHIEQKGFGTERIEEELALHFPDVKIARLDVDSARTRNAMQQIIAAFQERKTQVLIGTQMVAKGLDFDYVSLIGVINADTLLNYPDFRAFERSYQLLAQVAGRAGRRDKQGMAIIQAYSEEHRILDQVLNHDYEGMYRDELAEREKFNYPPFSRLIHLHIKHRDASTLQRVAAELARQLKVHLAHRVLGPEQPLVAKVRNYHLMQITLKIEKTLAVQKIKGLIRDIIRDINADKTFRSAIIQVDVDPY